MHIALDILDILCMGKPYANVRLGAAHSKEITLRRSCCSKGRDI